MSEKAPRKKLRWLGWLVWIVLVLVATVLLIVVFEQNMPANI